MNQENFLLSKRAKALKDDIVFVDLRIDYAFKLIFGTPGNEDLLLLLLDSILPEKHIRSVELASTDQVGDSPLGRKSIYDIRCTAECGEFVVEMQFERQDDFADRMIFYSSFPLRSRLMKGGESYKLTPLYIIGILDFILPEVESNDEAINHYMIRSKKGISLTESLHYVTVELPKISRDLHKLESRAEKLFYTIKNIGKMKSVPEELNGIGFEKIFEITKFAAMDNKTQEEYLAEFMAEMDARSQLRTARNDGLEEGEAIGLEKGEAIGLEKGRLEARLETAKNLKSMGLSIKDIMAATGLTEGQVKQL